MDSTRLPATDASSVRAPAGVTSMGNRFAQATPIYGNVVATNPVYAAQPRLAVHNGPSLIQPYTQTQLVQQAQPGVIAGSVQTINPQTGYPYANGAYVAGQPAVLGQGSTVAPQGGGGWRDRELTARR